MWAAVVFATLLNFYWASLMFQGLYRILKKSGDVTFDGKVAKNNSSTKRVEMKQMLDPE